MNRMASVPESRLQPPVVVLDEVRSPTGPRSRVWARVVGFLLFFVLLALVNRVFPGHARWALVVAALGAGGAVTLVPRLEAGLRRRYARRRPPPAC
jgi:hypothetical protein